jgi:hypothetical protein
VRLTTVAQVPLLPVPLWFEGQPWEHTALGLLELGLLRLRWMVGVFFALFFFFFFGGRKAFERFGDFLIYFVPDFVDVENFLLEEKTPGEIFALHVDQVDKEGPFLGGGGCAPNGIAIGPLIEDEGIEAAPIVGGRIV